MRHSEGGALVVEDWRPALVGFASHGPYRVAVYDLQRLRAHLVESTGAAAEDVDEHLAFNAIGAWHGQGTPVFLDTSAEELT